MKEFNVFRDCGTWEVTSTGWDIFGGVKKMDYMCSVERSKLRDGVALLGKTIVVAADKLVSF